MEELRCLHFRPVLRLFGKELNSFIAFERLMASSGVAKNGLPHKSYAPIPKGPPPSLENPRVKNICRCTW